MRAMRRQYQQVNDPTTLERWLNEAAVGRLATVDEDGFPTVKPVNFVYLDGKLYFHSAREGEKIDDIRRDARVGFEVDRLLAIVPSPERGCQTACLYESIIVRGRARVVDGPGSAALRERVLRELVAKHAPGSADGPLDDSDRAAVVEVTIDRMTGKQEVGQRWSPERRLAVARQLLASDGAAAAEVIGKMGLTMEEAARPDAGRPASGQA